MRGSAQRCHSVALPQGQGLIWDLQVEDFQVEDLMLWGNKGTLGTKMHAFIYWIRHHECSPQINTQFKVAAEVINQLFQIPKYTK